MFFHLMLLMLLEYHVRQGLEEIDLTTTNNGWLCCEVIHTITWLPKLKNVCFDSTRLRVYYGQQEHNYRTLYPHTCWGSRRHNREQFSLKEKYNKKLVLEFIQDEPCSGDGEDTSSLTPEARILNRLRWLRSKCNFTDLAFMSEANEMMDPLTYHEFKCSRGMFYSFDDDSDCEYLEHEDLFFSTDSSDSDGF